MHATPIWRRATGCPPSWLLSISRRRAGRSIRQNQEFHAHGDTLALRDFAYIAKQKVELADVRTRIESDRHRIAEVAAPAVRNANDHSTPELKSAQAYRAPGMDLERTKSRLTAKDPAPAEGDPSWPRPAFESSRPVRRRRWSCLPRPGSAGLSVDRLLERHRLRRERLWAICPCLLLTQSAT
jgi:hypothetical protein